jgi:hypothetical protein
MPLCCRILIVCAMLATITSTLRVYPHQLAYFNEAAGGPENGYKHLLGSNFDWGQDLLHVDAWSSARPRGRPLFVTYHGGFSPKHLGIRFTLPIQGISDSPSYDTLPRGDYAISINYLCGDRRRVPDGDGFYRSIPEHSFVYARDLPAAGRAGMTIYLFHR